MYTGTALVEIARPRRSKALPRHFVLAATATRIVAFKAWGGGDNDADSGPYTIRIQAGERGSWPRGSVRLSDLLDGPQSVDATLELVGEQLPVSRPNLNGDPDTDELLELLSGGAAGSREKSPEEQRYVDDQHDLRRAHAVGPGHYSELGADARRARPDVDLSAWAAARGLSFRGGNAQGGHLSVTSPWSADLLFNVVRGRWPGGTDGVRVPRDAHVRVRRARLLPRRRGCRARREPDRLRARPREPHTARRRADLLPEGAVHERRRPGAPPGHHQRPARGTQSRAAHARGPDLDAAAARRPRRGRALDRRHPQELGRGGGGGAAQRADPPAAVGASRGWASSCGSSTAR